MVLKARTRPSASTRPLGLAEIDAAGEFPHHQQIHPLDHLGPQGAGSDQGGDDLDGAQIGEQAQAGTQAQQAGFGPLGAGQVVEAGAADAGQQHRIGRRQASRVAAGRGSPAASIAAPPIGCSSKCSSKPWRALTASSSWRATAVISGPMPSPGSRVIR